MPRKEDKQGNSQFSHITNEQSQTNTNMEIEPENNNNNKRTNQNKEEPDKVPDLTGIEDEKVEDNRKSFTYTPEIF